MKTPALPSRQRGFTLVELLVVIAIIAVLAAASFAAVNGALNRARETKATVAATSLATALEQYYGEYNRLPDVGASTTTDTPELLNILLAEDGTNDDNPRQIVFLNVTEGKNRRKGGLVYEGDTVEGLFDGLGDSHPFTVVLNNRYDDSFTVTGYPGTPTLRNKQVAVFSPGADGDINTSDDNITSWGD